MKVAPDMPISVISLWDVGDIPRIVEKEGVRSWGTAEGGGKGGGVSHGLGRGSSASGGGRRGGRG